MANELFRLKPIEWERKNTGFKAMLLQARTLVGLYSVAIFHEDVWLIFEAEGSTPQVRRMSSQQEAEVYVANDYVARMGEAIELLPRSET
jgi:hypothetical protein